MAMLILNILKSNALNMNELKNDDCMMMTWTKPNKQKSILEMHEGYFS